MRAKHYALLVIGVGWIACSAPKADDRLSSDVDASGGTAAGSAGSGASGGAAGNGGSGGSGDAGNGGSGGSGDGGSAGAVSAGGSSGGAADGGPDAPPDAPILNGTFVGAAVSGATGDRQLRGQIVWHGKIEGQGNGYRLEGWLR